MRARLRSDPILQGMALWGGLRALEFAFLVSPGVRATAWPIHLLVLLVESGLTAGLCVGVAILLSRLPRLPRLAAAFLLAGWASLIGISSALLFREFGEYIHQGILMQLLDNPAGIAGYLGGYLRAGAWMLLLPAWAITFTGLKAIRIPEDYSKSKRVRDRWVLGFSLALFLIGLNQVRIRAPESYHSPEISLGIALQDTFRLSQGRPLRYSSSRLKPVRPPSPSPYNILVILGESWGAEELEFFPTSYPSNSTRRRYPMPALEAWLKRELPNLLDFPQAYSNSADTKVSVPSLMTGVSPEHPIQWFHQAPFLWDWAQASGLEPIYITSQRYQWCGFNDFFRRGFPGIFFSADDSQAPLMNDIGIDDALSLGQLRAAIQRIPAQKRFLAVYNPNAIHAPFQTASALLPSTPPLNSDRLETAHRILDLAITGALEELERSGRLQDTFVFFTGDHGTGASEAGGQARLLNYRDAVIRVPWMIRVPPSWSESHPGPMAQARKNTTELTANIDLVPSVLSVLWENPSELRKANPEAMALLSGLSVFEPKQSRERVLVALSPIRPTQGDRHGAFALLKDHWRLVYSTQTGGALFRSDLDPELRQNRILDPESRGILQEFIEKAKSEQLLGNIFDRHPLALPDIQSPTQHRAHEP